MINKFLYDKQICFIMNTYLNKFINLDLINDSNALDNLSRSNIHWPEDAIDIDPNGWY